MPQRFLKRQCAHWLAMTGFGENRLSQRGVILSVLQSAANLLILMIAGGNHIVVICVAESKDPYFFAKENGFLHALCLVGKTQMRQVP